MTQVCYAFLVAAAVIFTVASAIRAAGYARSPLHLRWELYPVPHESAARVRHGGSRYEEADWASRPVTHRRMAAFQAMASEVLLLRALRAQNPSLWRRSYPFHAGLYLLIGTAALLAGSAAAALISPQVTESAAFRFAGWTYRVTGLVGTFSAVVGAACLLRRRLTDPELRVHTTAGDIFNLSFFIAALGLLAVGYLTRPAGSPGILRCVTGLLTWDATVRVPGLLGAGIVASSLLAAYIPFTHMSHFIGKYFTYHAVRWDDRASVPGGDIEKRVAEYLTYRPTWSAPHVGADGTKTWADIATAAPPAAVKK
jgi:nitrate reductase gamma subunit